MKMMRTGELVVVVDSVEEAVKFYTEKLGFDIVELVEDQTDPRTLGFAQLRKSKCGVVFRKPLVEEFAEFSFIKRCLSRCVGLSLEVNKGIEKLFTRCSKKGIDIVHALADDPKRKIKFFTVKDPFGIKLEFMQALEGASSKPSLNFHGLYINEQDLKKLSETEEVLVDKMVDVLKKFGILRRAAKKHAKIHLKRLAKKVS
ncbi:MAG: VOC family protein [bacterium]